MSTPLDRLLSAARSAVQHVRGRYQTDEPDYMDGLASALGQYEQAVRHPGYQAHIDPDVVVTSDAHVVTCRCCNEELDADADFDSLAARGQYMILTLTCSHEHETSIRYVLASEAAGPVDIDETVGTTADTVTPLVADPDCQWCAGAGYVHGDPDLGCPACDERQVIVDAFRAGAEYMRRSGATGVMPDAERIDAAAAGYVEGLDR